MSHSESVTNFLHGPAKYSLNVEKYELQGSLVIVEAKKGYYGLINELVDITIIIKMLFQRLNKLVKNRLHLHTA